MGTKDLSCALQPMESRFLISDFCVACNTGGGACMDTKNLYCALQPMESRFLISDFCVTLMVRYRASGGRMKLSSIVRRLGYSQYWKKEVVNVLRSRSFRLRFEGAFR